MVSRRRLFISKYGQNIALNERTNKGGISERENYLNNIARSSSIL